MSDAATLIFEIFRDGALVRTEELSQDIIKVGKLPSSHLRLDDANVSRIHAVIERSKGGDVHIIDLGSSKGTVVNGQKVNKWKLTSGDQIQLGDTLIVFKSAAAPAQAASGFDPDATHVGGIDYGNEATAIGLSAMADEPAASAAPAAQAASSSVVTEGHYDAQGNWHDGTGGYYDPQGNYHDAQGGWYDTEGNYFDGQGGWYDPQGNYHTEAAAPRSDTDDLAERYTQNYDKSGTGHLEVAFLWNDHVLAVNQYKTPRTVTIGEAPKNTLQLKHPSVPDAKFPLIQARGRSAELNFTDRMGGIIHVGDRSYTLEEAISSGLAQTGSYGKGSYTVAVTAETRIRLDIGGNTFLVHYAEPGGRVGIGFFAIEASFLGLLALSLFLHTVFMFLVFFIPPNPDSFELDGFDLNNRFVSQLIQPEEPEETPEWLKEKEEDEGARAKEEEGKSGRKDSTEKDKKLAVKGPSDNKELKLAKDKEVVQDKLANLGITNNQLTASWGQGNETLGMQAITAWGDQNGEKAGDAYGGFAFGQVGSGRGGGGVSERGIGLTGGFGTQGRGGQGGNSGYGRNAGQLDERSTKIPQVVPGKPVVTGSLDKELIRRVIRKHRREIKYCYEKELIKNKNLAGRIVISFTISSTGRVVAAVKKSSTINNGAVESCVTSKVRRWIFPEPKGGGIVRVSYPFVFQSK